jgi:hypothetical protein
MKKSFLKQGSSELKTIIDGNTGEVLDEQLKTHHYLANSKEDFLLIYSSILGIFNRMEQSEIRVFSFLLQYADGTCFSISKPIRIEIANVTNLNERTVYNTIKTLETKELIFKLPSGAYQINPRYAFKGSTADRNEAVKIMLLYTCRKC